MPRSNFSLTFYGPLDAGKGAWETCTTSYAGYPKIVPSVFSSETTTGVSRRKPTGWVAPTPYSFRKERIVLQKGSCINQSNSYPGNCAYGQHYFGIVGGQGGRFNGLNHFNDALHETDVWNSTAPMVNSALIKARVKLKGTDINLGVAYGERKQTARLVGDSAKRLFKSLRHLKSGRIRKAMDELGISSRARQPRGSNVPKKWLELQYGWKPLLSDVYGAVDALNKRPPGDWRVTVKHTETVEVNVTRVIPLSMVDAGVCEVKGTTGAFVRIDALPSNSTLIELSSLGVTNPLLVGWELVPFSFIVDWFLPVGDYLDSLDALLGYSSSGTHASYSRWMKVHWRDEGSTGSSGGWTRKNDYEGTKLVVRLERTVSAGVDIPTIPRIKDPRSLGHMANGLALLSQFFGRTPK